MNGARTPQLYYVWRTAHARPVRTLQQNPGERRLLSAAIFRKRFFFFSPVIGIRRAYDRYRRSTAPSFFDRPRLLDSGFRSDLFLFFCLLLPIGDIFRERYGRTGITNAADVYTAVHR